MSTTLSRRWGAPAGTGAISDDMRYWVHTNQDITNMLEYFGDGFHLYILPLGQIGIGVQGFTKLTNV